MENKCISTTFLYSVFFFTSLSSFCQKNKSTPLDSTLEANSEKWKVKQHKGLFGIGSPEFGPYTTTEAGKLDSPVIKKRTRDSSETGVNISSDGWAWDIGKFETVEKTKSYKLRVVREVDTMEVRFSIYSISKRRTQTVVGELLSKNDEGKDYTISHVKNIAGFIKGLDSFTWRFFMEDYLTDQQTNQSFNRVDTTKIWLLTPTDSIYSEPIIRSMGKRGSAAFMEWQSGLFIKNRTGEHIAAIQFGDFTQVPYYVWIRRDLNKADQHAIASLFSLLIATIRL